MCQRHTREGASVSVCHYNSTTLPDHFKLTDIPKLFNCILYPICCIQHRYGFYSIICKNMSDMSASVAMCYWQRDHYAWSFLTVNLILFKCILYTTCCTQCVSGTRVKVPQCQCVITTQPLCLIILNWQTFPNYSIAFYTQFVAYNIVMDFIRLYAKICCIHSVLQNFQIIHIHRSSPQMIIPKTVYFSELPLRVKTRSTKRKRKSAAVLPCL